MLTANRSSIEKGSTESHITTSKDAAELDFGGDSTLPPPPKLTGEEEHRLYRKLDLRYVLQIYDSVQHLFTIDEG
jgi:hypothetical protein